MLKRTHSDHSTAGHEMLPNVPSGCERNRTLINRTLTTSCGEYKLLKKKQKSINSERPLRNTLYMRYLRRPNDIAIKKHVSYNINCDGKVYNRYLLCRYKYHSAVLTKYVIINGINIGTIIRHPFNECK